jgi:DNA-binding CsgD family transcriptional regulator
MTQVIECSGKSQTSAIGSDTFGVRHSRPRERLIGAESVGNPCLDEYDNEASPNKDSGGIGESPQDIPGSDLARQIGATGHAVFTLTRGGKPATVLRCDFPDVPPAGIRLLADRARVSIRPVWWAENAASGLEGLRWALRLRGPLPGPAGLAFPVAAGQDASGLVVFTGAQFALSDRALPDLHGKCFNLFAAAVRQHGVTPREAVSLTRRERECVRLAADGLSSGEIARALRLSLHTANQYLAEAARKLDANGRMHTVAKALRLGLID